MQNATPETQRPRDPFMPVSMASLNDPSAIPGCLGGSTSLGFQSPKLGHMSLSSSTSRRKNLLPPTSEEWETVIPSETGRRFHENKEGAWLLGRQYYMAEVNNSL